MNKETPDSLNAGVITARVVSYIMSMGDHQVGGLTVEGIARHYGMDRHTLARKFRQFRDESLTQFLSREKLLRSAYILGTEPGLNLDEVAERMGFCNAQYFSRAFKDFFGVTPGKYRSFRSLRSGIKDRRGGLKKKSPEQPDRRVGPADRRE